MRSYKTHRLIFDYNTDMRKIISVFYANHKPSTFKTNYVLPVSIYVLFSVLRASYTTIRRIVTMSVTLLYTCIVNIRK